MYRPSGRAFGKASRQSVLTMTSNDYIDPPEPRRDMESSQAQKVLNASKELRIAVTGRRLGRERSTPVWFVREEKTVFLLPVTGSHSQWYKNVEKSRRIKISSGKLSLELAAKLVTDAKKVGSVADKFRKKYGAGDVKKYYSRFDAAIELGIS